MGDFFMQIYVHDTEDKMWYKHNGWSLCLVYKQGCGFGFRLTGSDIRKKYWFKLINSVPDPEFCKYRPGKENSNRYS